MSEQTSDLCAAYGCPMLGVYGASGKWYCPCHFNLNPALNDAVTLELGRLKPQIDHVVSLRRQGKADAKLESEIIEATREIGRQRELQPVEPHPSEVSA